MLKLRRKTGPVYAVEVKGRDLAPAIHVFDNADEVESLLAGCYIPADDVSFDGRSGLATWTGGFARIGNYVVCDEGFPKVYETLSDLQEDYEVVEDD